MGSISKNVIINYASILWNVDNKIETFQVYRSIKDNIKGFACCMIEQIFNHNFRIVKKSTSHNLYYLLCYRSHLPHVILSPIYLPISIYRLQNLNKVWGYDISSEACAIRARRAIARLTLREILVPHDRYIRYLKKKSLYKSTPFP